MSRELINYLSRTDIDLAVRAGNLIKHSGLLSNGQFIAQAEKLIKELTRGEGDEDVRKKLQYMVTSREYFIEVD